MFGAAKFPRAFNPNQPRPLAVGIGIDIAKALWPGRGCPWYYDSDTKERRALGEALAAWVNDRHYLEACTVPGATRFNLDGRPEGVVSASAADYAAQRLTELYAAA